MTGNRIGVLIAGPFLLGCAALAVVLNGVDSFEALRITVLAGVGGWIIGRWR